MVALLVVLVVLVVSLIMTFTSGGSRRSSTGDPKALFERVLIFFLAVAKIFLHVGLFLIVRRGKEYLHQHPAGYYRPVVRCCV